jgi:hypothetical protein
MNKAKGICGNQRSGRHSSIFENEAGFAGYSERQWVN